MPSVPAPSSPAVVQFGLITGPGSDTSCAGLGGDAAGAVDGPMRSSLRPDNVADAIPTPHARAPLTTLGAHGHPSSPSPTSTPLRGDAQRHPHALQGGLFLFPDHAAAAAQSSAPLLNSDSSTTTTTTTKRTSTSSNSLLGSFGTDFPWRLMAAFGTTGCVVGILRNYRSVWMVPAFTFRLRGALCLLAVSLSLCACSVGSAA